MRASGRELRARVRSRLDVAGYTWWEQHGHEDVFVDEETGHQVVMAPWPRWGSRIDILTLLSSFPLPTGVRATTFHFDLASQLGSTGASEAGRWTTAQLADLLESVVVPYLQRARSAEAVCDMLLDSSVRPMGSAGAATVLQHGYYIAKWWQLEDRVAALRDLAAGVSEEERAKMERAPWGRTEIAEVLWRGRELPAPPARPPWGLADQGDPRAERWYRASLTSVRSAPSRAPHDVTVPSPARAGATGPHIVR